MSGMVNADELMVLAFAVCDERATDAQIERIEEILDGNRAAKLLYLECLDLHSDLEYRGRRFGLHRPVAEKIITAQIGEFLPDQLSAEPAAHPGGDGPAAAHGTVPVIGYPWLPLSLVSSVPWAAYAMAGLLLVIGVLAAWTWRLSGDRPDSQLAGGVQVGVQISATEAPAAGKTATPPILSKGPTDLRSPAGAARKLGPSAASKPPRPIVGRITAMSGVVGTVYRDDIDRNVPFEVGTPVRVGCKFVLDAGRLEVTYDSGAKVVIAGPGVDYIVERENGGFLALGKLTVDVIGQGGRVGPRRGQVGEPERESGKSGLSNPAPLPAAAPVFIVRTPYVNVNDSNGEFAITVNKDGGSYTRVFRGRVVWRTQEFKDDMSEYAITLKENYQVRLELQNGFVTMRGGPSDPMRGMLAPAPVVSVEKTNKSTAN